MPDSVNESEAVVFFEAARANDHEVSVRMANSAPVTGFVFSLGALPAATAAGAKGGGQADKALAVTGRGKGGSAAEAGLVLGTTTAAPAGSTVVYTIAQQEGNRSHIPPSTNNSVLLTSLSVGSAIATDQAPCFLVSGEPGLSWARASVVVPQEGGNGTRVVQNQIHDCLGHCSPIAYIGDKYCDNNNNHNFNCEYFSYDEGDCNGWGSSPPVFIFLLPVFIVTFVICCSSFLARLNAYRRSVALRRAIRTGTLRATPSAGVELRHVRSVATGGSPPVRPTDPGATRPPPLVRTDSMEDAAPPRFLCPITQSVMDDPVVAADGNTYEREAITKYMSEVACKSPLTNQPMSNVALVPNLLLRSEIRDFVSTHSATRAKREGEASAEAEGSNARTDAADVTSADAEAAEAETAAVLPASMPSSSVPVPVDVDPEADVQSGGAQASPTAAARLRRMLPTFLGGDRLRNSPSPAGGDSGWAPLEE